MVSHRLCSMIARPTARLFALAFLPIATPAAAQALGDDAAACRGGHGPAVAINLQGLKDRRGQVWVELYPATEADFLRDDTSLTEEGKTFRRVRFALPATGPVATCIRVPRAGRYALLVRHNRTGKDKFSFWSDGAGFATDRPIGRSRPQLAQATIDAGGGVTPVTVRMQYLHGLRGFAAD